MLASAGAVILAFAYLLPMGFFAWSLVWGRRAPANPWGATGLEWQTSSPPPEENFRHPAGGGRTAPTTTTRKHAGPPAMEREQHQPAGPPAMSDIAARERRAAEALAQPAAAARGRHLRHLGLPRQRGDVLRRRAAGLAVYRSLWPEAFAAAARETNIIYGTVNTALLLTSSLTMAAAAEGARAGLRRLTLSALPRRWPSALASWS